MNIEQELLGRIGQSKAQNMGLTIANDTSLKEPFLACFKHLDQVVVKNTAWLLTHIHNYDKHYFQDKVSMLIGYLAKFDLDGVLRCILRCLQDYEIPTKDQGVLISLCFQFLTDNQRPIAVKVFAMTVIFNHCDKYPELKNELKIIIEDLLMTNSPGIISRGSKILKKLSY